MFRDLTVRHLSAKKKKRDDRFFSAPKRSNKLQQLTRDD